MIEAVVQTGMFETPYRRLGSGAAVLLLTDGLDAELAEWLFHGLARGFRTIAPVRPGELGRGGGDRQAGFETWLRGVIDGLGLDRPGVVAGAASGPALRRFAHLDPDRLHRLALVGAAGRGPHADPALRRAGRASPGEMDSPLVLTVPCGDDASGRETALRALIAFLGGSRETPQAVSASRRLS